MAVGIDVKWAKNRGKVIQKIYVNPAVLPLSPVASISAAAARLTPRTTVWSGRSRSVSIKSKAPRTLSWIGMIGCTARPVTEILSAFPASTSKSGRYLPTSAAVRYGMQFDKDENLIVCVGGMGV